MSWLTDTLIVTGALIALVLVLRRPVARWCGPGMAYALWALPLLRLVLPPLVLPEGQVAAEPVFLTADTGSGAVAPRAAEAVAAPVWPLEEIALTLWFAGALAFIGWRVWSYRRMRREVLAAARPVGEAGDIRLVESPAVASPVAFGLRDKVVALPPGFMASEDRVTRDLAIAHELEHHAGRDIAVIFAMQPLLALHWFNPLAWTGWRAMRRDQEAACDARVLAGRCQETRVAYAGLIARFAQGQRLSLPAPLACPVVGEKSIVHRLRSLSMNEPSPHRRLAGRLMIGAAALALPLTATITYAAVSQPEPPAPPEAPAAPQAPEAPEAPAAPEATQVEKRVIMIKHKDGDQAGHGDGQHQIVIIDNPQGSRIDDDKLHTRVIERDGKRIVLKTASALSEAEAEARVSKAMASMAEAHAASAEAHAARSEAQAARSEAIEAMVEAEVERSLADAERQMVMASNQECKARHAARAHAESSADGKKRVVHIAVCVKGEARKEALSGLREARDEISRDGEIPAKVRDQVLRQLDAEIARLSTES